MDAKTAEWFLIFASHGLKRSAPQFRRNAPQGSVGALL